MNPARLPLLVCPLLFASASSWAQGGDEPHGWSMGVSDAPPPAGWDGPSPYLTVAPAAAYRLEPGDALDPRVAPRDARVFFDGRVQIEDAGRYRFGLAAEGVGGEQAWMLVEGDKLVHYAEIVGTPAGAWSGWTDLPRGSVRVLVRTSVQGEVAARLQLSWQREPDRFPGFGPEPIPSRFVRPIATDDQARALAGRELLDTKGCTSCHAPGAAAHAVGVRPGPDLARVGARVQPTWLLSWIQDPSSYRASADMPDLFGEGEAERADAEAVVHFLMQKSAGEGDATPDPGDARGDGEMLYHTIGCVACHGARLSQAALHDDEYLSADVPDDGGAPLFPLEGLERKWRRRELARFLADPAVVHRDGRMPSFAMTEVEAQALAFALVPREVLPAFQLDAAQAARGREVFAERGCAACHSLGDDVLASKLVAPALTALRDDRNRPRGCLDPAPDPGDPATPRYDLSGPERTLLLTGLHAARSAVDAPAPLDELQRRIDALGCARCHRLDGAGGPPAELDAYFVTLEDDTDLGDEGRLPPDLSDVGVKLATPWLEEVLTGDGRARPWIATRMPHYGQAAEGMAELFARRLGVAPNSDAGEPQATDALTLAGRQLMDRDKLSCVACHLYKDYPPSGTVGPDITKYGERLRYEWFAAYMQNPTRYKPGTRMPTFVDQSGKSTASGVLGGDLAQQVDALWSYFSLGEDMPPPPGVEPARGMPVLVGDRPRVMRSFLEDAGSRGIAVGFPVGIHFAYDAEKAKLVSVWRGDFLDASGAWAGRGGNVSGGRGATLWSAPKEWPGEWPLFLYGPEPERPEDKVFCMVQLGPPGVRQQFKGYRLEPDGTPVFLSTTGNDWAGVDVRVEESWRPHAVPEPGFLRRFRIDDLPKGFIVLVAAGPNARLERVSGGAGDAVITGEGYAITAGGGPLEIELEVSL